MIDMNNASSPARTRRLLYWVASPHWMLAFFVFAGVSALVSMERPEWITAAWSLPLAVFALSLLAAVATNARFRRDAALLGLHLGLLVLVLLIALARLTYLDGAVTLSLGSEFDGRLHLDQRGPLHPGGVERLRFANEGFTEDFNPRARWKSTYNRVRWWDANGDSHVAEIGDDQPLVLEGYRIYATFNRGYSPVFRWQPVQGDEEIGTVQLQAGSLDMANSWQLTSGPEVWTMIDLPQEAKLQPGERRANMGAEKLDHRLILRVGDRSESLRPGESMQLPEGRLTYVSLETWMGYRLVYDVAMYWMASATLVVVLCMLAFYARVLTRGWRGSAHEEKECN